MTQYKNEIEENMFQKISGVGFIMGVLLIVIGALFVPRTNEISNVQEMQKKFGEHPMILQFSALLMIFGFWAVMIGIVGIFNSIQTNGAVWARLGFYFNFIGTAIWTVGMSLDISYPAAIVNWLASPDANKEVAYSVVAVLSPAGFGRGLFPIEVITIWLSYIFIGAGMARSNIYPRWQGNIGLIMGISGFLLGIVMVFTGREKLVQLFIVLMMITIIWLSMVGVWMVRKYWLGKIS